MVKRDKLQKEYSLMIDLTAQAAVMMPKIFQLSVCPEAEMDG